MSASFLLELSYLIGSISFIVGLKMLSHPETARRGNIYAAVGMGLAILATILFHKDGHGHSIGNIPWILAAMAVGTIIGYLLAMKVQMTAMPQMVSLFNGMGGACAAIISIVEYMTHPSTEVGFLIVVFLGLVIGSISFSGSMVAYGKLVGKVKDVYSNVFTFINIGFMIVIAVLIYLGVSDPATWGTTSLYSLLGISLVLR